MALLERHRNIMFNAFVPLLGEEVTQAVLAYFPARDVEEMVTKEHLDRRFAEQTADIDRRFAEQNADIDRRFAAQNAEFNRKLDQVRTEFTRKLDDVRADISSLRVDVNSLRVDVAQQLAAQADKTFHRMLTIAGLGLGAMTGLMTALLAAFT